MAHLKIKNFLDRHGIKYVTIQHSEAYTAQEIAQSAHISGRDFAKTVVVMIDDVMAMVVLPASQHIALPDLRELLETNHVRLASEEEFKDAFLDCELGAMPPFGNLYNMPVFVAETLTREAEIAFNAGTYTEVIKMAYADFESLVQPTVLNYIRV